MKRTGIDWEQVHARLSRSQRALEETLAASPERIEKAYRERAARLARRETGSAAVAPALPVLVFLAAGERYAIELKDLAEVLPFSGCTPVPGAPARALGVINLRGELRAVLDLGRLLAAAAAPGGEGGAILILRDASPVFGLKVDAVEELRELRPEELSPPQSGTCVRGIAAGPVMLLSAPAVLNEVVAGKGIVTHI